MVYVYKMGKRFFFLVIMISVFQNEGYAQAKKSALSHNQDPLVCYSSFKDSYNQDVIHSMQCVRQLAADKEWGPKLLPELLHNFFMEYFFLCSKDMEGIKRDSKKFRIACTVLDEMVADTCKLISDNATPIQYWVNAFLNCKNEAYLSELVDDYIETQLTYSDIYKNKAGRYALLIHQIISKSEYMYGTSQKLLSVVIKECRDKAQEAPGNTNNSKQEERAYYRFLYAYGNYLKGIKEEEELLINQANEDFKTAFDYSPDYSDMINPEGFIHDMADFTIFNTDTFKVAYVDFLSTYAFEPDTILSTLRLMAIQNPAKYKEPLKKYYSDHFAKEGSFSQYWLDNINKRAKDIPPMLSSDDKEIASFLENNKGKWVFLDFWGLWCAPCLREQPEIENFYKNTVRDNHDKIVMYALDYKDSQDQLDRHMVKNKYTFPVVKEDGKMVKIFNITNWPTKILITPQRKYIEVPLSADWATFVKMYADL